MPDSVLVFRDLEKNLVQQRNQGSRWLHRELWDQRGSVVMHRKASKGSQRCLVNIFTEWQRQECKNWR